MDRGPLRRVCINGRGYLAITLALWLRKFSPRLSLTISPIDENVISPRHFCGMLRGESAGARVSSQLIRDLVYPNESLGGFCDVEISVREPSLSASLVEEIRATEELVFPPTALGVQLAFCALSASRRGIFVAESPRFFESNELADALLVRLKREGLLKTGEASSFLREISLEPFISIRKTEGIEASLRHGAYLDESIEMIATAAALEVLGRRYSPPPNFIVIDAGNEILFEVGRQEGETTAKVGLGGPSHFIRLIFSRKGGRVVGARGVIPKESLASILDASLVLLAQGDICEHLPTLAAARSHALSGCSVLRGLLGLAAKLCI